MSQNSNNPPVEATLVSRSLAETHRLGALLGELLVSGDVILLQGALGAGKTAFTQGIARGLGVTSTVNSPTFTILKEYVGRLSLYHFDLYRIETPEEVSALGFEDYFGGDGVSVVEWAERGEYADGAHGAASPWPASWLHIRFSMPGAKGSGGRELRELHCSAHGARGMALLAAFAQAALSVTPNQISSGATPTPTSKRPQKERAHAAGD